MELSFSHYNQFRENGALPRTVWLRRGPDNMECLGIIHKTTYGKWVADITNPGRGKSWDEFRTLREAKAYCRRIWNL